MSHRAWSDAELAALRRMYTTHAAAEIGAAIGRSKPAVHNMARALGLRKSPEWVADRARMRMQDPSHPGYRTRFAPGHVTWNAGMKGLQLSPATQFKPGQRPQTWRPIGTNRTSKEGYLQRKIADTGCSRRDYVPVHHLVWRMHGGTIPPGHALAFRNGNKAHIDINNLELITRAELMARNTVHNLPPRLKAVIVIKRTLARTITLKERTHDHAPHD